MVDITVKDNESNDCKDFNSFNLDKRLVYAINELGFKEPTLIQSKAIPLALEGKDILAQARTGSGKTAAYIIPIINRMLSELASVDEGGVFAVIMVPTKELSLQVTDQCHELLKNCSSHFSIANIGSGELSLQQQAGLLSSNPRIVVGTPFRVLQHLVNGTLAAQQTLKCVVFDEADLLFSYGYASDVQQILPLLPQHCQHFMMSATLPESVRDMKNLVLRNPVVLQLQESKDEALLSQYMISLKSDFDRFLAIYFLLKLKVHPFGTGRILIFVRDVDRLYFLKLYLDQFGIKSAALNAELPVTARYHIIQEFNRGVYDILIATDDAGQLSEKRSSKSTERRNKRRKEDAEYGVARGIDFHNVQSVINFDLPTRAADYVHRVGRTARGVGNTGNALSLTVAPFGTDGDQSSLTACEKDELSAVERIKAAQAKRQQEIQLFALDATKIEPFRYRCKDAFRAVTPRLIKEARIKEISKEILASEKLKRHFEAHPADYKLLRHDLPIAVLNKAGRFQASNRAHLKHVPDYLMPDTISKKPKNESAEPAESLTVVGTATGVRGDRKSVKRFKHSAPKTFGHLTWKKLDPLKSVKS